MREAAWLGAIAFLCGFLVLGVAVDAMSKNSDVAALNSRKQKTGDFILSLDATVLDLGVAEAARLEYAPRGDQPSRQAFEDALEAFKADRTRMLRSSDIGFDSRILQLEQLLSQEEVALDPSTSHADDAVSKQAKQRMNQIRALTTALRADALASLHAESRGAELVERGAGARLTFMSSFAMLCILGAIVGGHLQGDARRRLTRRYHAERLSAMAANRTKSSFLAYTSHELRTPLNAIIGFSEFMLMEYAGPLNERQKQYLQDIRGSGLHLQALISDILDLTKAEAGKITLAEQTLDVAVLLSSCMKLVEGQAKEAGVALIPEIEAGLPRLKADELRCKQVLINALLNALQATPQGGEVRLSARSDAKGAIEFTISDTSPGIPAVDLEKAIEPYLRSGIDEPSHKGFGLGLPLARKIVELHGGSLKLRSELGTGTTVTVTMPAERAIESENAAQLHSADIIFMPRKSGA